MSSIAVNPVETVWRLSVEQYHAMIAAGILGDDDTVELLEGVLVPMAPKHSPHRLCTELTRDALATLAPSGWFVESQEPVTTDDSEPEPDVAVVRGARRDFLTRHPGAAELALVVEVADSSLARDRGAKKRIFARAGVLQYWIVNLVDRQVEAYGLPSGPGPSPDYASCQTYGERDEVPLELGGQLCGSIRVADILP